MSLNSDFETTIRRHLLGLLDDDARAKFEQQLMVDDELFDQLQAIEDELIDDYVSGRLNPIETELFETKFLVTPERRRRLQFAKTLRNYMNTQAAAEQNFVRTTPAWSWSSLFSNSYVRVAAFAALFVVAALGLWRFTTGTSDVDKGLVALNAAYREQRPIEARISQLNYAPYVVTRGPGSENFDESELRLAELTLLEAVKRDPNAASRHALGKVYLAKKEFDKAINEFQEALKLNANSADIYADLAAAWLEKGKTSLQQESTSGRGMEELGRSLENSNKALQLNGSLLEPLFNKPLAEQYLRLETQAEQDWQEYLKHDSSSPWAEEARKYLKQLEDKKKNSEQTKDRVLRDFLAAYQTQNDSAAWEAVRLGRSRNGNLIVQQLLDEYLSLENSGRVDEANQKLKTVSYAGKLEAAKVQDKYTSDVVAFYVRASARDRRAIAEARLTMKAGIALYYKAEWAKAIELFNNAKKLFSQVNDEPETLFAEAFVGYSYLRVPEPKSSTPLFIRLSKSFAAKNYRSLHTQSLHALADAFNAQNEFSKALDRARESLTISEQIEDFATAIRCLQVQTSNEIVFGDYRESLAAVHQALNAAQKIPPDVRLIWPLFHEASIDFFFLGLPQVALQFEDEALRMALGAGLPFHASRSYDRLAVIHERLGDTNKAIENSNQARAEGLKIPDERARTNVLAHAALVLGKLQRETGNPQQSIASFDEALQLYGKLGTDLYQYQARKGKLLSLIQLGDDSAAEAELEPLLYWFEQNREKIVHGSRRDKFFDTEQDTYEVAVDFVYARRQDAARAFNYAEAYRARSLLDLVSAKVEVDEAVAPEIKIAAATKPLTLSEVQSSLPERVQLLEYSVLDDKVVMWVVTRNERHATHSSVTRSRLDEQVKNFVTGLSRTSTHDKHEVTRQSQQLYATLIAPASEFLKDGYDLFIVPDGSLNFLPFNALISPSGKYLVEDYTIETAPSATVFVEATARAHRRSNTEPERLLAVGNPSFRDEKGLGDLRGAEREAKEIARLYGANALIGSDATVGRLKTLLFDADVVHLATHAVPDESSPLLSRLALAVDPRSTPHAHHATTSDLHASEIYRMKLPRTQLVVLSACQTSIEQNFRGEGAIGLARPFIAAGVPLVVATLWPVESESTADLMISFHKHRKNNHLSTAEALRHAQRELLQSQRSSGKESYTWAAFVVIGGYANY